MRRYFCSGLRVLRFEQLEARHFLTGNVTVEVVAGSLVIIGDSEHNEIEIYDTENPGDLFIYSLDRLTTINSQSDPVVISGVTGDVFISLGDGYDRLFLIPTWREMHFPGNLNIDMGSKEELPGHFNSVLIDPSHGISVAGSINFYGGYEAWGNSFRQVSVMKDVNVVLDGGVGGFNIVGGSVSGNLTVTSRGGNKYVAVHTMIQGNLRLGLDGPGDTIVLQDTLFGPLHVMGSLYADLDGDSLNFSTVIATSSNAIVDRDFVATGSGSISFDNVTVGRHVVATLDGESIFSIGTGIGGNGAPSSPPISQVGGNFIITSMANSDFIRLNYLNVAHDLAVVGGNSVDDVRLFNVRAGNSLLIDTGAGNDIVWIHNSSTDGEAAILTGFGSDYVRIGNVLWAHNLYTDLGAGFDLLSMTYTSVAQSMYLMLGADSDQATVSATSALGVSLNAGSGYDAVRIETSATDYLFASLADGDDSLVIQSSLIRASALLDGGPGYDLFSSRGNLFGGLAQQNFEQIGS